jgi:hypothetical protein
LVTWFDKCPERLEAELRALTEGGFPVEIDADARASGEIKLKVMCTIEGSAHQLIVTFPSGYPYFAFQVAAPSLDLARHQDPVFKTLCFARRIETAWKTSDTVAQYLLERLPLIIEANNSEVAYSKEEQFGAPLTGYLPFAPGTVVLISHGEVTSDAHLGTMSIGIEANSDPNKQFRGAVLEIRDEQKNVIARAEPQMARRYKQTASARWLRLPTRPKAKDATELLEYVIAVRPELKAPRPSSGGPDVIGVVFPDEVQYRQTHDTWLFIVRAKERTIAKRNHRLPPGDRYFIYLVRPDRAARVDLQARVRRVRALQHKKVTVIGIGALGSMAAWQLARAGVGKIVLGDADVVNIGTSPRWMLATGAAGHQKTAALRALIEHNYPYVEVEEIHWRVGATAFNGAVDQNLRTAFDGSDLVMDCTAEFTIQHYLSDIAWERRLPFIWCTATDGGWGGVVGRAIRGRAKGCWSCFRHHRFSETIRAPAAEPSDGIQPLGCFSPTFTGTGFDMDGISIMGARLAAATLCHDSEGGYPDFSWDVGVVDQWSDGNPIAPRWTTYSLERYDGCDCTA